MDAEQRTEAFAAGGRNAPDPPVEAFDAEMWRTAPQRTQERDRARIEAPVHPACRKGSGVPP